MTLESAPTCRTSTQIADPGELDVGGEDGVVHVPEGVDVTEPHLDARAVAEVVSHGGPILQGAWPRAPRRSRRVASSVGARHDAGQVQPLVGRVVVAADRAQAVERRQAQPGGGVGVAGAAGGGVRSAKPSSPAMVTRQLGQASGGRASSPSAGGSPAREQLLVTPSTGLSATSRCTSARGRVEGVGRAARRSSWSRHSAGTTFGRVPPAITPAFSVTPGQRPLSAVECHHLPGAAARIALRPFSGSTPACAARPVKVELQVGDALARADDVAVGAGALEHQR